MTAVAGDSSRPRGAHDAGHRGQLVGDRGDARAAAAAPRGVFTSRTIPGVGSAPEAACNMFVATWESELGGTKPPELFSEPASGPPMAPATTTNTNT